MIVRELAPLLRRAAATRPVVMLSGPRQSGKRTLCRALFPKHAYRRLEAPDTRAFAMDDPHGFLAELRDDGAGGVIDEIERVPELVSRLRSIVDDDPAPGRWILVNARTPRLPQSLAGRGARHELLPLTWSEIRGVARPPAGLDQALFAGGYPEIHHRGLDPTAWLRRYTGGYLERDVRGIVNVGGLARFHRFLGLCATRVGQPLNYASLARHCGISHSTARRWVDLLETSFIVFRLPACPGNVGRRLVKAPRLYFYDTGLVCWLLGIHEASQLSSHPLRGAIFRTWVVSEAMKCRANRGRGRRNLTFYRDWNGVEADLVIDHATGRATGGTTGRATLRTLLEARSAGTRSSAMFHRIRRVRGHFTELPASDPVVVYGGDEHQRWADGELVPWRMVRTAALRDGAGVVQVLSGGRPVAAAEVLAVSPIHPNVRWKLARTDVRGEAILQLDPRLRLPRPRPITSLGPSVPLTLPLTLFVAAPGFEAWLDREWIPAERAIVIDLARLPGGGGVIFPQGWGDIPGLAGRVTLGVDGFLSPFGGTFGTTRGTAHGTAHATARIRAENIAINGEVGGGAGGPFGGGRGGGDEAERPVYVRRGEASPLVHLEDADGSERWIRVRHVVGRSALVEYRPEPVGPSRDRKRSRFPLAGVGALG